MKYNPAKNLFVGKINVSDRALQRLNIVMAVLLAAQAAALLFFGVAYTLPVNLSFLTTDSLQSKLTHATVLAPAMQQLSAVNVAYLVATILVVSALFRLAAATICRSQYQSAMKQRSYVWRWVGYSLTGGLMAVTLALVSGMHDVVSLLLIWALAAVMYMSAWGVELAKQVTRRKGDGGSLGIWLSGVIGVVLLAGIGLYLIATNAWGVGYTSAYVYGMYAVVAILFIKQIADAYLLAEKKGAWSSYTYGELWYVLLSFVGETVFAWLIFAALLHP